MPRSDFKGLHTAEELQAAMALLVDSQDSARRFADADKSSGGELKLDFDEFLAMLPLAQRQKRSMAELRQWFDAVDASGNGVLTVDEFFLFTLACACERHGMNALMTAFYKYDPDGTGELDAFEFQRACKDTGFGLATQAIFRALDLDNSGTVSLKNILGALEVFRRKDEASMQLLSSLRAECDSFRAEETRRVLETRDWVVRGESVLEVREEMQRLLAKTGCFVVDVIRKFDADGTSLTQQVDRVEFTSAMKAQFGYVGSLPVLDGVFDTLDLDGSGKIGFDEARANVEALGPLRRPLTPPLLRPLEPAPSPRPCLAAVRVYPRQAPLARYAQQARARHEHGSPAGCRVHSARHRLE
jgi:Ca2+-binding EF-hand superfamily protein